MARFRYRMQNILDIKEKLETNARNEFAIASSVVIREEDKLDSLKKREEDYREELKELQQGELDFMKIKETTQAVEAMKYHIVQQEKVVERARNVLEIRRAELAEAMLEVKMHEKLKDKEFKQFLADEASAESKVIDELVSYKFGQEQA